jgi:hypothetical protein
MEMFFLRDILTPPRDGTVTAEDRASSRLRRPADGQSRTNKDDTKIKTKEQEGEHKPTHAAELER